MAQKKVSIKSQSAHGSARITSRKASTGNGARSATAAKASRNGSSKLSADERMLRLWKEIYEEHHRKELRK